MPPIVGILFGVILLLVLLFAIAYASGWTPRTAGPSGEGLAPGVGPERKAQIAIAITLAIGLLLLIYGLSEPSRQAEAYQRQRETSIEFGAHEFAQYCYGCHGYNGQGAMVPGQNIMAANLTLRKATGNPDDDKKLFDFLTKTITRGRPNTPMPAWGLSDGGSLQPEEINELAVFIMNGDYSMIPSLVAPGAPTPILPEIAGGGPEAQALQIMVSKGCGACHTIQGTPLSGTVGPNLSQVGANAGTRAPGVSADDYIRNHILQGSGYQYHAPGFQPVMPPFQGQLTDDQLNTLVAYLSTLGTPQQGQATGAPAAPAAQSESGGPVPATPPASGTGTGGGAAQPNPASAPGGQITTPSPTQPQP
ncbi:MAG TPA: c-type cytochrome [Chloroflexota bacterium]|nr:c-type cytochrome [Chloroflexota bacterium]